MADDDIAVTIEPDEVPAAGDPAVAEVDSQYKEMQAKLARAEEDRAAERRRTAAAESRAQQAASDADRARTEVVQSRADTVTTGIDAATAAISSAENEIAAAIEAGNVAAQTKAYTKLATATARLERLTEAKADLEIAKTTAARPAAQPAARAAPLADTAVEAFLSERSPKTAAWLREHADYAHALATGSDPHKQAKINAAHNDALLNDIALDSPEYFAHVETKLGLRESTVANGHATNGAAKPAPARTPARRPPVAPVSSSTNAIGAETTVRLSAKQAAAATDGTLVWNYDDPSGKKRYKKGDPIGHQEMARRVKAQTEQGLFRPENTEI